MSEPVFAEYASKLSEEGSRTRRDLPAELRSTVDQIEANLMQDPNSQTDRVIAASLDGKTRIYKHPDPLIEITFEVDDEKKVIYFFHYTAPTFRVRETIVIGYSHVDERWLTEFEEVSRSS